MKSDYDAVTGLMTLGDGSIFLCLTREQKQIYAQRNPDGRIWHTTMERVLNITSDIYVGKRVFEEGGESCKYHKHELEDESSDRYAWCVPLDYYNDPSWGDCIP